MRHAPPLHLSTLRDEAPSRRRRAYRPRQTRTLALLDTEGDDMTTLTVAQEGQESKLDEAVINIAKEAMKEEEPKEE